MLLEVRNLTAYYDTVLALDDISLNINEGEIVAMIGPNGAGKSTALKAICGLVKPKSGEVLFRGENINGKQPYQLVEKGLCLVPEGRRVFTSMTVLENLEMGGYTVSSGQSSVVRERIEKVFELFPVLKERRKQRSGTLSSGEQQMLAIGRALMLKPKLLLLDEPSLGLSPNYMDTVFEKIKEINIDGTTILLVEQNARMALEYANRGYVFEIGKIAFEDKAKNLLKNDLVRKSFLGER
ncbi:MAG: ABC transporter ATP-binding protein [Acidobacteria bacterium]|nr:ABC transporter ATP-binding protein [Acidobacteriota bacterium]MBU4307337.1 ABC transporter ATP-binding protein [Acidobacteriota bacterium]MCG2810494.1 ABC transporter ATP-binding protein [Candidatus Aminicenantes bacterium]MCG2821714.1 ABC transporter ATP-binding protein [Candidatus Atribacteria bacterium]